MCGKVVWTLCGRVYSTCTVSLPVQLFLVASHSSPPRACPRSAKLWISRWFRSLCYYFLGWSGADRPRRSFLHMALVQAPTLALQQPFKESTSFVERRKSSAKLRNAKLGHSVKAGEKRKSWQEVVRAVPRASANTHARANIPVIVQLHHQPGDLPDVPWNKYLISSRSNIAGLRSAIASDFKTARQWEHPIHLFCTGNDVELDYSASMQTLDNNERDDDGHVYVSVSALPGLKETTLEPIAEPERTPLLPRVVPRARQPRIYLELQEPQVLQPTPLPPLPSPPPPLPSPRPPPLEPLQPSLPLQKRPPKPPLEPALTSSAYEKICSTCLIAVAFIIALLTATSMHFGRTAPSISPSAACVLYVPVGIPPVATVYTSRFLGPHRHPSCAFLGVVSV